MPRLNCAGSTEFLTYDAFLFPVPPPLDWGLAKQNAPFLQGVRDLVALRTNASGLGADATVRVVQVDQTNNVVVTLRHHAGSGSHFACVVHMGDANIAAYPLAGLPVDGSWVVRYNSDSIRYSPVFGNFGAHQHEVLVSEGSGALELPAYAVVLLSPSLTSHGL